MSEQRETVKFVAFCVFIIIVWIAATELPGPHMSAPQRIEAMSPCSQENLK